MENHYIYIHCYCLPDGIPNRNHPSLEEQFTCNLEYYVNDYHERMKQSPPETKHFSMSAEECYRKRLKQVGNPQALAAVNERAVIAQFDEQELSRYHVKGFIIVKEWLKTGTESPPQIHMLSPRSNPNSRKNSITELFNRTPRPSPSTSTGTPPSSGSMSQPGSPSKPIRDSKGFLTLDAEKSPEFESQKHRGSPTKPPSNTLLTLDGKGSPIYAGPKRLRAVSANSDSFTIDAPPPGSPEMKK